MRAAVFLSLLLSLLAPALSFLAPPSLLPRSSPLASDASPSASPSASDASASLPTFESLGYSSVAAGLDIPPVREHLVPRAELISRIMSDTALSAAEADAEVDKIMMDKEVVERFCAYEMRRKAMKDAGMEIPEYQSPIESAVKTYAPAFVGFFAASYLINTWYPGQVEAGNLPPVVLPAWFPSSATPPA